jgi:threonyl-tRNA synthetase
MSKIKVVFPDKSEKEFNSGVTGLEIAQSISEGLGRAALACYHDDNLTDLTTPITTSGTTVKIVTFRDSEGVNVFRHSSAHILAQAVKELYPKTKLTIGPSVEQGFYYDFDVIKPFSPEDLEKIEAKMKEIVNMNLSFVRKDVSKSEAIKLMKARGESYKVEMIEELDDSEKISVYYQGDNFVDFCRGPHVPSTKYIKAVKLTKLAGAYWKGDAKNKQLQRVYGISFPDKKLMKEHLTLLEEAEKRDHRKIGKELRLFSFHEDAPGMPFFHDKGTYIWNKLVEFTTELMTKRGYEINKTPIILNNALWKQSGHWNHYKDNMYATKIDGQDFAVKPMNCPGNILVFKDGMHSYRDLPIKAGEFGLVHRHELSGVLSGLFRVRCFTQDDAHVFCTEDQIKDQIKELMGFVEELYGSFGFEYHMELSTRPEKAMGDPKLWELAETILKEVLDESDKKYQINPGDGAFYGPKIDFHLRDAIGRTWQCGTIQLDFQMPEKFDLTYEGSDGKKHRPVMLHRAILGSVERFMGVLIEHFAGKFPLWISPNQVKILPIADRHFDYAKKVKEELESIGLRVEINSRSESIPKKVREAQLQQFNYILVVGDKDLADNTVTVRLRGAEREEGAMKIDAFKQRLALEIKQKKLN